MNDAFRFLVEIIFDLYLMVVLLRFWMQMARADFYNPLSQFIVKATSPLLNPIRKITPGLGGFDLASLVLAIIIAALKVAAISLLFLGGLDALTIFIGSLITVVKEFLSLVFWVLIIRALLSWVSQGHNPIEAVFHQLTEPMLRPIRKVIPPIGGLDLSILILIIAMQFIQILFLNLMR
jgi:YggT family protein